MINLKHSVRTLLKSPFVSGVAVLSLALGIGANSAVFSLFDELLRRPLPVAEPERLVNLAGSRPNPGTGSCGQAGDCDVVFSYPMFRDLQNANSGFSGIAGHVAFGANIAYQGVTVNGDGMLVSGSYFPVLGLHAAAGRLFDPQDDTQIGQHFVTVLSYGVWQSQFGASPAIIGQQIVVNGKSMTVLGVAPPGFEGTTLGTMPKVFVPISMYREMETDFDATGFEQDRTYYWVYAFARLKPGVSIAQANAAINAAYSPIIRTVEAPLQKGTSDSTMRQFKAKVVTLEDGRRGQSNLHQSTKTPLLLLMCISALVLLIACANIANLLLARGASRSMEVALRLSLGATRRQIIAQLLTESMLLALTGGVASLFVARWTLAATAGLLPSSLASALHASLNGLAVTFAAALSLATGVAFGLFPALHSTRTELAGVMRDAGGKQTGSRSAARFRTSLVTAQMALSMALLAAAGLFVKSLGNVSSVDLGLKIDHIATFRISPVLSGYEPARSKVLFDRLEHELAAIPGVTGVTSAQAAVLGSNNLGRGVRVEGFPRDPDIDNGSRYNRIGPAYFNVLGVPLLAGRDFTTADALGRPKVAIINETFARKFNLGRDVLGKRMSMGGDTLDLEIVGLVKDSKYSQVKDKVPPVFYIPYRQEAAFGSTNFYVRSGIDPAMVLRSIPSVVKKLDPNLPVSSLRTLEQVTSDNVFLDRMITTLSAAFAVLATLLAAIGLYGVLAYSVAQRTREIGVRMALGANAGSVQLLVIRQMAIVTLIGGAVGIAGALALGMAASSLLYELKGYDPAVMAMSAGVLVVVALAAAYFPALRASRVDPMYALRHE